MSKKPEFSKKILETLAGKPAIRVKDLPGLAGGPKAGSGAEKYALTRSLKNLSDSGLIETLEGGQDQFARLTQKGRQKLASHKLESKNALISPSWDGKWRIILLDLPESRKAERESLRYLLKKAGFMCLKNSAWVSPFPFEFLFANIKKDFGLTNELMVIVTDQLDEETKAFLFKSFKS